MKTKNYNVRFQTVRAVCLAVTLAFPLSFVLIDASNPSLTGLGSFMLCFSVVASPILWIALYPKTSFRNGLFARINNRASASIPELASLTGKTEKTVIKHIQSMIRQGYITQYRFDMDMKTIQFYQPEAAPKPVQEKESPKEDADKLTSVRCENCGAPYTIFDKATSCPYCNQHSRKKG